MFDFLLRLLGGTRLSMNVFFTYFLRRTKVWAVMLFDAFFKEQNSWKSRNLLPYIRFFSRETDKIRRVNVSLAYLIVSQRPCFMFKGSHIKDTVLILSTSNICLFNSNAILLPIFVAFRFFCSLILLFLFTETNDYAEMNMQVFNSILYCWFFFQSNHF